VAQEELQECRQDPGCSQPGEQDGPAEDKDAADADDSPEAEVPVAILLRPPLPLMAVRHVISIGNYAQRVETGIGILRRPSKSSQSIICGTS